MDNPALTVPLMVALSMRARQHISPQLKKKHRLQQIQTVIEETSELPTDKDGAECLLW